MKNSKLLLLSLFASAMVFGFSSCKDNNMKKNDTPSVVDDTSLTFMVSSDSPDYLYGDVVTYTIQPMNGDQAVAAAADANIRVTFTGTATTDDGKIQSVTASDVFDNYQENTSIKKGATSAVVKYTIKSGLPYKSIVGTFSAFSRGNNFKSADVKVNIYKNYEAVVSIQGQSDLNAVKLQENAKFQITLTLPKPAKSDVVVNLTTDKKDQFDGLPTTLKIAQGQTTVTSAEITVKPIQGVTNQDVTAMISLESTNAMYPTNIKSITVIVQNPNKALGSPLTDERWVYKNPDEIFVSAKNKDAVEKTMGDTHQYQLMKVGDAHPNSKLAAEGWKFLNSMEFSPIGALINGGKENQYKNRVPSYVGTQNVALIQRVQAVNNDKYTNMDDQGYLEIWSAHDPGIQATGGGKGTRDYGTAALFMNKFKNDNWAKWKPQQVKILPGTRIEVRVKLSGKLYGFNPAIWLQGNLVETSKSYQWPYYGEIDMMEAPQFIDRSQMSGAWQTFHWTNVNDGQEKFHPSSNEQSVDLSKFVILWLEYRDDNTLAMGINGQQTVEIQKASNNSFTNGQWSYSQSFNTDGFNLLITFGADNSWADNQPGSTKDPVNPDWNKYLKDIPYDGSKTNPNTPKMEIDWIRYYTKSNYTAQAEMAKKDPMY